MKGMYELDSLASKVPYFSRKHVAHMVHVHPRTVRRWIADGRIDAKQFGYGGAWYVGLPEINRVRKIHALPELTTDAACKIFLSY
jgi:phage terminase large subunit GpA-like protein